MRKKISRRAFTKGLALGTGSFLLPNIQDLYAAGTNPLRFVFVIEGNGVNPGNFLSAATRQALNNAGGSINAGDRLLRRKYGHSNPVEVAGAGLSDALALGSLTAAGEPSLLDYSRVVLGLSNKVAGGGHTSNYGGLSCSQSQERIPSYATIDHILGSMSGIRGVTPFDVVRLGVTDGDDLNYHTCATGANAPAPIVCDPATAYYQLFGSVAPGGGSLAFTGKRELLDFVRTDIDAAMAAFNASAQERYKLEKYKESVERLIARHNTIVSMETQLTAAAPSGPGVDPDYASDHILDHLDVMFDLTSAALIGGLTNVAVIASATGPAFDVDYTDLGLSQTGRHSICHAYDYNALTTITERHVSLVSKLARDLLAVPEGSGTVLDNTVIIYTSDNGEKHHSNAEEWPILMVGGNNHGLGAGNRSIVYPGHGATHNRQLSNLFSTLSHMAGSPINAFGNDINRIVEGPLSELWTPA